MYYYTNRMMMPKKGDVVRLAFPVLTDVPDGELAIVTRVLLDIDGGVMLDRELEDFGFWNVMDLEVVGRGTLR